jgi:hypothetical protein
LTPQYLTISINYETPLFASFSSHFPCLQFKRYTNHSLLKQNQQINGKMHFYILFISRNSLQLHFNQQNGAIKQITNHISYCIATTTCFTIKAQLC